MFGRVFVRLRYLIGRARRLSPSHLFGMAGAISKTVKRPRLFIVADMLWCAAVLEAAFQDYYDWDFQLLTRSERRTFMTHPKSNHLVNRYNQPEYRHTFRDKIEFNTAFPDQIGRAWLDVRQATSTELRHFALAHGRIMAKVPDSLSGIGIRSYRADEIVDWDAFRAKLLAGRQFLVEEFIVQHHEMDRICPTSVNSLRMISFFDGQNTTLLASVLKIGNGGDVDNFSSGGMYTMLDDEGVARYAAFDAAGGTYSVHPLSGVSIVGFRVPDYREAIALVNQVSPVVPQVPYIGWDVAVTPNGPILIEGNPNSGVYQLKPSLSGVRTGLLPVYRAAMQF
ncbi:MAG: sugar-transfer associated ATP-grasp domain-containing protein [Pseudolysinimonas sp.]